jgi:hypothetical protein
MAAARVFPEYRHLQAIFLPRASISTTTIAI